MTSAMPASVSPAAARAPAEGEVPAVSIRGISRTFGGVTALGEVSLDIRQGEFFSLLGPSGCGKTTLLRIIGGFETPTSGALYLNGRDVVGEPPFQRRTNMVFQHGALFPHLTVAQNVAFGLEMKRMAAPEIGRRVAEALEMVRLGGYGERRIDQLSGGQRQRIALARALVNEPEVLLLDEPLSALDLQLRLQMQEELRRLQRQTGGTFIFVTHDQGEAITMSDRLAVMQGGCVIQVGTPRDVYERPARRFVAEFIGHSNFLPGTVLHTEGGRAVVRCEGGLEISGHPAAGSLRAGEAALVALRYEKIELTPASAAGTHVTGEIVEETYLGPTVRRRVALSGGGMLVAETSNTAAMPSLGIGRLVDVGWSLDAVCIVTD